MSWIQAGSAEGYAVPGDLEIFDFVVVGGGSSGCVLANRLSADPSTSICLIEAGGNGRSPLVSIPTAVPLLMQHKSLNWRFSSTPQKGANGRRLYVPRGRGLGGSSSINGMVYIRGHRKDYDDWAAAGNIGWSFEDVLPYFKRSECNEAFGDDPYHGAGGELNVQYVLNPNPLVDMMREAVGSLQMPLIDDFNGAEQEGFGMRQVTQKSGRRVSASNAFLAPVRHRPNLKIILDAMVDKLVIQEGAAVGVHLLRNGEPLEVRGRREIILAAGAIGSPAILMRSGIGPAEDLAAVGLDVVHHSPEVGNNLQDHLTVPVQHVTTSTIPYGLSWKTVPFTIASAFQYALARKGLFATNVLQAGGYLRSDPTLDRPDIQFLLLQVHRSKEGRYGIGHGYGISSVLLRPWSRGSVKLGGRKPQALPRIDFDALTDSRDLDLLVKSIDISRRILASAAWDRVRGPEYLPGEKVSSKADVEEYVRNTCSTAFHPVGTCRMGTDAVAVVDPTLRVNGIARLRIADASIMPRIIGGNTNAPTIMIAEKASDMILDRSTAGNSPCR